MAQLPPGKSCRRLGPRTSKGFQGKSKSIFRRDGNETSSTLGRGRRSRSDGIRIAFGFAVPGCDQLHYGPSDSNRDDVQSSFFECDVGRDRNKEGEFGVR